MGPAELVYQGLLAVAAVLCVGIGSYAWRRRRQRGAKLLTGLFAALVYWVVTASLVVATSGTPLARAVARSQYVGITLVTLFVFLLALEYTGREQYVTRSTVALLLVHPVLTNVAAWVPPLRDQFLAFGAPDPGSFFGYAYSAGPLFAVHTLYSYVLLTVAAVLYVGFAVRSPQVYRRQTVAIVLGILAPWAGNALFLSGLVSVDVTPLGFVVTGLALWWAIFHHDLVEIVPIARGTVVDNLNAGVVVLDQDDRVVDVNPRGRELLALGDGVIGQSVTEALDASPSVREAYDELVRTDEVAEREVDGDGRTLRVQVSSLTDSSDAVVGHLLVVEDVTEQKRRQRELERQNEQLEQFAGIVSHDLRNPLNVAAGHLELARRTGEAEHFDRVEDAHERMNTIIDDVLTLAREGRRVEATDEVTLGAVARDAWATVQAPDATLEVADDRPLQADADRLQRALENLFRNSVEHGSTSSRTQSDDAVEHAGPDVTVTVGTLADDDPGFYVADDGPGIPPDRREAVFENGHTTSTDGTGFGLAIVESIVEAHGWTVEVTDDERTGGARFEVTGLARRSAAATVED